MRSKITALALALAFVSVGLPGQPSKPPVTIRVDATHPGATISPQMFGIFFEDINFGADGGLYPELVKNRSFEFNEPLAGWHEVLGFSGKGLDNPKG
jgi:alpha-N-arabinofuranosidase